MFCREFAQIESLYLDDALAPELRAACDEHLQGCPLCRADAAATTDLLGALRQIAKPAAPPELAAMIRQRVRIELAAQPALAQTEPARFSFWQNLWENTLRPQILPYATGALASTLLFTLMFVSLRNSIENFQRMEAAARRAQSERAILLATTTKTPYEELPTLPAADYAARRLRFAAESPSLDPNSQFVALTSSLTSGNKKNPDSIMIVADVLSDGIANIADVITAPRDSKKMVELEKLLHDEPAFVPAALDRRPDTVRVVFLIQKVEVREPLLTVKSKKQQ